MKPPRDWPIMRLLAGMLVSLVALSLLPATLLNAWDTSTLLAERSRARIEASARDTAERIEGRFGQIQAWAADFSDRPGIRGWLEAGERADPARKAVWEAEILRPFMKRRDLRGVFMAAPSGRILLSVGSTDLPVSRLTDWESFRRAARGEQAISEVHVGTDKEPYYALFTPVYNPTTSKMVAILGALDHQKNLRAILERAGRTLEMGDFMLLTDENGVRIAHGRDPHLEGVPVGGIPAELAASYAQQKRFLRDGSVEPGWADREGKLRSAIARASSEPDGKGAFLRHEQARAGEAGYTLTLPIKDVPWVLAIGFPESVVTGPVGRQLARSAAIFGILLALAVGLAMVMSRWFTRPIRELIGVTERQAGGDLGARAAGLGNNELGQLASSFNQMADSLQAYAEDLEAKVQARTAELASANTTLQAQTEELQAQTEELQAQSEELQSQAEEMESQRTDLEEAYEELRKVDELKARLFSGVSHDLRTPLQVVVGLASILAEADEDEASAEHRRFGDRILAACHVLQGLIDDLLELSRIESGRLELQLDQVDYFPEIVLRSVELLRTLAEEKQQSISFVSPDEPVPGVTIDLERIGRVLANLIGNAIKFTPVGGEIRVFLSTAGERIVTSVADTGPGMPPEAQEYLFEPFYRVPGTRGPGTGLGLAIARQIVEAHGGRIGVESEVGRGATLWFSLPVSEQGAAAGPESSATQAVT